MRKMTIEQWLKTAIPCKRCYFIEWHGAYQGDRPPEFLGWVTARTVEKMFRNFEAYGAARESWSPKDRVLSIVRESKTRWMAIFGDCVEHPPFSFTQKPERRMK